MDFIICFPREYRQHDSIMVVVEKLTKEAHVIPLNFTNLTSEVARVFIKEILRLHGIPRSIVSDRDAMFT